MARLDRYIGRQVLLAMVLVLLVLGGLDLLFTFIDELGETEGQYGTGAALRYVLFTFPFHLYELLPMTALIGALAGLGVLAAGNEIVAMQAAGIKRSRIVLAVMKPAVLVMLLGLLIGEVIAPPLELRGQVDKAIASGEQVALSRFGHWERDGSAFMHFNAIEPAGILYGVSIFVFDAQQRMVRNVRAERAVFVDGGSAGTTDGAVRTGVVQRELVPTDVAAPPALGEHFWVLEDGVEMVFTHREDGVDSMRRTFVSQGWDMDLTPDLLQVLIVDPDQMAISDLYRYAQRFARQGQDADAYYLSFWKKVLQPLTTAVLVLLAISFIFGPLRDATMGSRIFTAICVGLTFTILQNMLHTMSLVYQFEPLAAVLLPLVLCAALGYEFFRRAA
jgi:lipopolysaccharide export system permease protein